MGNKGSQCHRVNDKLPQGSVLALTLFNLCISDLPKTKGTKFKISEDIEIACQSKDLTQGEENLNADLDELIRYF